MRKFKTESKKLLNLMINSIYTNREIFLRELISNASDAEDKLYFRSLTDQSIQLAKSDLVINVSYDPEARTVTVSDNGIGMDKDALDTNLGIIAHSDSLEFKNAQGGEKELVYDENGEVMEVEADEDVATPSSEAVDIIGQFGVGFYSAFMVGKKVRVVSRALGDDNAWAWESDGVEGYTISAAERDSHGTDVIVYLKDNTNDENYDVFCTEYGLQDLIKRYSNYVRYPIQMLVTKTRQKPEPDPKPEDYTPEWEQYTELETINSMTPIWKRRRSEVTQEEYNEFYKSQFHDFTDPQRTIVVHAEGAISYDVLLFIPGRRPYDFYSKEFERGLQLYSSNVLIMDKCEELVPEYYGFVRGVVSSQDLTLNISRETLQHNSQLRAIAKKVERKITSELGKMRDDDREAYEEFFENFGRALKYGIYTTYGMAKETLGGLLLFYSAKEQKMVTLDEYVAAMPEDQKFIYYAAGESADRLGKMPMVTSVTSRGYDVLLCTQDVDDFCFQAMENYAEKGLRNVASADLGLENESDKTAAEETAKENEGLLEAMKNVLGDAVTKVQVSSVLVDAPAAITAEGPLSLEMEKVLAGMPDTGDMRSQRVLELNAKHPVFETMRTAQEAGDSDKIERFTKLLYNQALLVEGLPIEDPVEFANQISELMK